jgi:hypothetical protein
VTTSSLHPLRMIINRFDALIVAHCEGVVNEHFSGLPEGSANIPHFDGGG